MPWAGLMEGKGLALSNGEWTRWADRSVTCGESPALPVACFFSPKPGGFERFVTVEGHLPPTSGSLGTVPMTRWTARGKVLFSWLIHPSGLRCVQRKKQIRQFHLTQWFAGISHGGPDPAPVQGGILKRCPFAGEVEAHSQISPTCPAMPST